METRQTTNLKIAGSTPARLVFFEENKGKKKREKGRKKHKKKNIRKKRDKVKRKKYKRKKGKSKEEEIVYILYSNKIKKNQKGRLPDVPICVNIMVLNRL